MCIFVLKYFYIMCFYMCFYIIYGICIQRHFFYLFYLIWKILFMIFVIVSIYFFFCLEFCQFLLIKQLKHSESFMLISILILKKNAKCIYFLFTNKRKSLSALFLTLEPSISWTGWAKIPKFSIFSTFMRANTMVMLLNLHECPFKNPKNIWWDKI